MLHRVVRAVASTALEWFYRDVEIVGAERIPREGALLLAVNHPNQLVDAMVVLRAVPRRVRFTAKATLFEHPIVGPLFRWYGIVPLRRAKDEAARLRAGAGGPPGDPPGDPGRMPTEAPAGDSAASSGGPPPISNLRAAVSAPSPDPARNLEAFRAVLDALAAGEAVLVFPEGISHGEPQLAPLRTGIARLALQARDDRGVRGVRILPIGLVFERKWAPRTRIVASVGEAIALDEWPGREAQPLVDEVDARLRATTLNFPTATDAARILGAARLVAAAFAGARPLGSADTPLADEAAVARRMERARAALDARHGERVARFEARLEALRAELDRRGIPPNDVAISPALLPGARFALREGAVVALGGPPAWWGRLNHWLPLRLALALGRRTSRTPEDPAMHTIVLGLVLVLAAYAAQTALVWRLTSGGWALAYLLSLPLAASWDLRFRDRMRRAARRTRAWLQLRRDPTLQPRLAAELAWVREEALALETLARS